MASVQTPDAKKQYPEMERTFVGRGWQNKTQDGREFINLRIDRGVAAQVDETCQFQLWPNKKREGKKDADFRLSILIPKSAVAQA